MFAFKCIKIGLKQQDQLGVDFFGRPVEYTTNQLPDWMGEKWGIKTDKEEVKEEESAVSRCFGLDFGVPVSYPANAAR